MTGSGQRGARRSLAAPLLAFGIAAALALGGCATASGGAAGDGIRPTAAGGRNPADPFEAWNRKVHAFNEKLDEAVLRPVATAYNKVLPQPVRTGVGNFFNNFADAWSAVNNLLQGKLAAGLQDVVRVGINTVFGVFGLIDMAGEAGIDHQYEDFGQTLGRWGFGPGPYIVWPLFGPSTLRDTLAMPLDRGFSPAIAFDDRARYAINGLAIVDTRARLLGASRLIDDIALDKYQFLRDGYLQRRRSLVRDGAPEPEPAYDDGADAPADVPAAPAAPASASSAAGK